MRQFLSSRSTSAPQNLLAPQEKALPRPAYHPRASNPFDHAWTKDECFAFKLGSGIEVRFRVPELTAQGPESDAKTSLPSWAPMLLVMSKASGTAEAESSLSWPYSVVELLTGLPQQSQG